MVIVVVVVVVVGRSNSTGTTPLPFLLWLLFTWEKDGFLLLKAVLLLYYTPTDLPTLNHSRAQPSVHHLVFSIPTSKSIEGEVLFFLPDSVLIGERQIVFLTERQRVTHPPTPTKRQS